MQRTRRFTQRQLRDVIVAILDGVNGAWISEDRIAEAVSFVESQYVLAHHEHVEFERVSGAATKAEMRQLPANLKAAKVKIIPELEPRGKIELVYTSGRRVDLTTGRIRRCPGSSAWDD